MRRIYLDYAATTPVDPRVAKAMVEFSAGSFGNASSIHSFGREAKVALEESRVTVARAVGAREGEIFFTSGGTEADNHALFGVALAARRSAEKNHIVISAVEHHAVLHSARYLGANGFNVTVVPVDGYGKVDPDDIRASITSKTAIVSVMHANNEIGTIQPVEAIAQVAHEHGCVFHSDTVQSVGKVDVSVDRLGVDLLAVSAHKFYGPKGIGAIYVRRGVEVDSLLHGGAQERNRRAGTENVSAAVGFAKAAELALGEMDEQTRLFQHLKDRMKKSLSGKFDSILFNGHPTDALPGIVNVSFDSSKTEIDGEALLLNMDLRGVAVTSGSACSSGGMEPSHVLHAIGRDVKSSRASIRFSFGKQTTESDVDQAVDILEAVVRKISPVPV